MKSKRTRILSIIVAAIMIATVVPFNAFAVTTNADGSFGTNGYYNIISKKEWTLIPGAATETEMVLNNAAGTRRQVIHVIEVDPSNPDVSIVPGYYGIDKDISNVNNQSAAGVTKMAAYYEDALGYNVVGGMNTDLDYTNNAPRVLIYNGVDYRLAASRSQSVLCVYKAADGTISCDVKAYNDAEITAELANGNATKGELLHAVGVSFAMVVNNGELVSKTVERTSAAAARSMVGVKEDGTLVICMNDGRGANNSIGFCVYEEGEAMLALGCKWAANCDGGGSSSFVTKRVGEEEITMRSVPCDGAERPTKTAVFVVSNVGPTGELNNVNIEGDYDYFAPGTTYTFGAEAIDTHGYAMDIPTDAAWALSDDTFGTITDGTFVSGGKTGNVDIQIVSGGTVIGSKTICVANPTTLELSATSTVVPYSTPEKPREIALPIVSRIGEAEVYYDTSIFNITLSNPVGTLSGFNYLATTDTTATGTNIVLEYLPTGKTLTYSVQFGKGSEILFDFEDQDLGGFLGQQDTIDYLSQFRENPFASIDSAGQASHALLSESFIASRENGGQVHNGQYSLGYTFDMTQVGFNNWVYANVYSVHEPIVFRDVANGNKATSLGMWVYIPEGFYTAENAGALAMRFDLMVGPSNTSLSRSGLDATTVITTGPKKGQTSKINALTESDIPDNRWIYAKVDLTGYNCVRTQNPMDPSDGYNVNLIRMYVKPSVAQSLTYYFDEITLDYSSAVDDRIAPTISDPQYATSDTNNALENNPTISAVSAGFSATVTDVGDGIDPASAAIYVDGNKVSTTQVIGNTICCDNVTLALGTHNIKFEISDILGNTTTLTEQITSNCDDHYVKYISRVVLDGHNDSGTTPMPGSVYYIDVKNTYEEAFHTATFTLELSSANEWLLDQITTDPIYEVSYSVNPFEKNRVTFTVTDTVGSLSGRQPVMFTIPVRVYNPYERSVEDDAISGVRFVAPLRVEMTECTLNETRGCYDKFVVSELEGLRNIYRHNHTANAVDDSAATCTEDGYTGRTYCDACASIVDFGTFVPASDHSYEFVEGVLQCANCGEAFNGTHTDGKDYIDGVLAADGWSANGKYYIIDGAKVTGELFIDGVLCHFDENGVYDAQNLHTGLYKNGDLGWMYLLENVPAKSSWIMIGEDWHYFRSTGYAAQGTIKQSGRYYSFEGEQGKTLGAWEETAEGKRFYFCSKYQKNSWREIDGETYYFENTGYCCTGKRAIIHSGEWVGAYEFDESGKLIGEITGVFTDAKSGTMYYAVDGVVQNCGLIKLDGNFYYVRSNYTVVAGRTWYVDSDNAYGLKAGAYMFGADGKMEILNGIVDDAGTLRYYIDGVPQKGLGLVEVDGDYYYVRSIGVVVAGRTWYVDKDNEFGLPAGAYMFAEDGKMIYDDGIVEEDGNLYYYIKGVPQKGLGLVEVDGDYYYVRSAGVVVAGRTWYVDKDNSFGFPAGTYTFGADGKMVYSDGLVETNGVLYYYIKGVPQKGLGLIEVDGDYYYVRSAGVVVTGRTWYVDKDNSFGFKAGTYTFGADGKMVVA